MSQRIHEQLLIAFEKFQKTLFLLKASVKKTSGFDINKTYSADELEPYDALSDRFIRVVELSIKLFRTYEYYVQAQQSETLRDGLHQMEKLNIISNIDIWLDMRDIRNRIVHDYMLEKIAEMYQLIRHDFYSELNQLEDKFIRITMDNKR